MIQKNMLLTGNRTINRLNFINIIDNAMRETCTKEFVLKSFSATGVLAGTVPIKLGTGNSRSCISGASDLCSTCRKNNVELHPLVKQGCIPKKLADVFTYSIAPGKARSQVKTVECARIITSEQI